MYIEFYASGGRNFPTISITMSNFIADENELGK